MDTEVGNALCRERETTDHLCWGWQIMVFDVRVVFMSTEHAGARLGKSTSALPLPSNFAACSATWEDPKVIPKASRWLMTTGVKNNSMRWVCKK